ncbi:ion transporter [Acetobacteraceae bacterium]|nr:ion transporter [Candidatus Parcubacteria bacterium]
MRPERNQGRLLVKRLVKVVDHPLFERAIYGVIGVNVVVLFLQIVPSIVAEWGEWLHFADRVILWIFVVDIALRLTAYGPRRFVGDGWNWFDVIIVGVGFVPAAGGSSGLRALRALRLFRLLRVVPEFRQIIEAIALALTQLRAVFALCLFFHGVFALMATLAFQHHLPEQFGSYGRSMYTLFLIATLNVDVMEMAWEKDHLGAWLVFPGFILTVPVVLLAMVVGILGNALAAGRDDELRELREHNRHLEGLLEEKTESSVDS